MSAKARATTFGATSCCASPSPSERSRAPSPQPSPAPPNRRERKQRRNLTLADRAASDQLGQQGNRGQQRVALLPWLQADVGPGMAVDFPRDIFGAARERQARLAQPGDRIKLPVPLLASPPAAALFLI